MKKIFQKKFRSIYLWSVSVIVALCILIISSSIARANITTMFNEGNEHVGVSDEHFTVEGGNGIVFQNDSLNKIEAYNSEEKDVTVAEYNTNVANLNKISIKDVELLFSEKKDAVLYIGRPTCYYCRQFSPEIMRFNQMMGNSVVYYDTDGDDFDKEAENIIFNKIGIPGTPTTLYIREGEIVSAWVGGGISAEFLHDFLLVENCKIKSNALFTIKKGKTIQMHVNTSPVQNIVPLKWTSENETVANLNEKGQLTAVSEGITKINITTIDGKSDSVVVRVTK